MIHTTKVAKEVDRPTRVGIFLRKARALIRDTHWVGRPFRALVAETTRII
jgi:hypothetical protein